MTEGKRPGMACERLRVLHVVATMNPVAGGVPVAVMQMSQALEEIGHRSEIVTLDSPDAPWVAEIPGTIYALGPSRMAYGYNRCLRRWLEKQAGEFDALIAHGIWQYNSLAVSLASKETGIPYFVYPHGQLDPWFKHEYPLKHAKKWLYWPWGAYRVLRDAVAVFFTSERERLAARDSFWLYRASEVVVAYGIEDPPGYPREQAEAFFAAYDGLRDKRLVLFLSRIHNKKGCDLLIEGFARVADRDSSLHLVMAGPDQDGWRRRLEALARTRGLTDRITWTGMLTGDPKWGAYRAANAFILPSHSENFGIVVVEALSCGVPVLITDKVNIWAEIIEAGAGMVEEDTVSGTVALLDRWLNLTRDEADYMRTRARACFETNFEIRATAKMLAGRIRENLEG
jgi:glycosyltransferase involved in cell wall biosynthesis